MRKSRRLAPHVARLRRMVAALADCAVVVTEEPGYERPLTVFALQRPLPWRRQDDLCVRIHNALGDWCRERWIEPTLTVEGPRIISARPTPRRRSPSSRRGARAARAR